jgi:hypothetical protein
MEFMTKAMNEYEPAEIEWLWPGRIPRGKLTLLFGDPGLGKSYLTAFMAAVVSRGYLGGAVWPDGSRPNTMPADVVMLSGEDDPHDTIRPRLERFGARLERVHFVEGVRSGEGWADGEVALDRHVDVLARRLAGLHLPRLIIVDPISAYLGDTDSHNNAQVRAVLKRLSELARSSGAAVVCVTHASKAKPEGARAVHRAMGSLAFAAAARVVWQVSKHPANPDERTLLMVKSNLPPAAQGSTGLIYRITPRGELAWSKAGPELDVDDVESPEQESGTLSEAVEFLKGSLGEEGASAERVITEAERVGISARTLRRAKRLLGVSSAKARTGRGEWMWMLPRSAA